jgi:hypothetical protein
MLPADRAGEAPGAPPPGEIVLDVQSLRTEFRTPLGMLRAVDDVSFTVRRGDEVVLGDLAERPLEQARMALAAGEVEAALRHLEALPPGARQAMKDWTDQAEALLAARAALRQMAPRAG